MYVVLYICGMIFEMKVRTNIKTFPIKKHYLINSLDEKETNIVASGKATREKARKYEYV